jgi:hypothetical protein
METRCEETEICSEVVWCRVVYCSWDGLSSGAVKLIGIPFVAQGQMWSIISTGHTCFISLPPKITVYNPLAHYLILCSQMFIKWINCFHKTVTELLFRYCAFIAQ